MVIKLSVIAASVIAKSKIVDYDGDTKLCFTKGKKVK